MPIGTINTPITSDNMYTSELIVQGHQRFTLGIWVGSLVSYVSVVKSTASLVVTLQRQMAKDEADVWRDVDTWAIQAGDAQAANREVSSDKPEPTTVTYRLGCKTGEFYGNAAPSSLVYVNLETS